VAKAELLETTARAMVAPGKGILAIDETPGTCTKRFDECGIASTPDNRRAYRELLLTAPGLGEYISGAILVDETFRQTASDGRSMIDVARDAGILPGIKVDAGARPLAGAPDETVTEGLDHLRERLEEYQRLGATFTKWRAVISIGAGLPTLRCIAANAHALGRYASLAQESGLVPIVEPELLMSGSHDIDLCQEATEEVLRAVFAELATQHVLLEGIVLKPNMVTPGASAPEQASAAQIADATLATLRRCVPAAVPGIAFLSGGQTGEEACERLSLMACHADLPWQLTFSFGRALQYPALDTWSASSDNAPAAQADLLHRARMSSLARGGSYTVQAELAAA
jgi:fructose-bisphosphate aldolase class I